MAVSALQYADRQQLAREIVAIVGDRRHMLRHLGRAARQFSTNTPPPASAWERFWAWTLQQRPSWRESPKEAAVIFVVFGITGSTSVGVVRPALKNTIGLEGSMREGPWSYRITSLLAVSPIYATFLVTFGTIAGRHIFFANMARKIFGRFVPASLRPKIACPPALEKAAKGGGPGSV